MSPEGGSVPDVGAFLLGAPKSGTTWLAAALEQHPKSVSRILRNPTKWPRTRGPLVEIIRCRIGKDMSHVLLERGLNWIVRFMHWPVRWRPRG